jgi:hypothetical protein
MLTLAGWSLKLVAHTGTTNRNMRTKLLLTAVFAAGLTVAAQVYSVNVVGYVNVPLNPGFTIIANQLDAGAGLNLVDKLLGPGLPDGTMVYKLKPDASGYVIATYYVVGAESMWDPEGVGLAPGEAAFIRLPGTASVTVTFVGEVKQGTLVNPLPKGFSLRSSIVPQKAALSVDTTMPAGTLSLGFPAVNNDMVYMWNTTTKKYDIYTFYQEGADSMWDPTAPTPEVGQGFFVRKVAAVDWTRTFNVNE